METDHNECIDCGSTHLLEIDHNPAYHLTRRAITTEVEPRCGLCHRARQRFAAFERSAARAAA